MATNSRFRLQLAARKTCGGENVRCAASSFLVVVLGVLPFFQARKRQTIGDRTLLLWAGLVFAASIWPCGGAGREVFTSPWISPSSWLALR